MTRPTIDDHRRNAVRYPACNCGAVWTQRGNITGHCTRCHETFDGVALFDRHQRTGTDGRTICLDPADITLGRAETHLESVEGVWRGPRMPAAVIAARFGSRAGTERRTETALAPEQAQRALPGAPDDSEAPDAPTAPSGA